MTNWKGFIFDGFKGAVPPFTKKKDSRVKSGYLVGSFGCLGQLDSIESTSTTFNLEAHFSS